MIIRQESFGFVVPKDLHPNLLINIAWNFFKKLINLGQKSIYQKIGIEDEKSTEYMYHLVLKNSVSESTHLSKNNFRYMLDELHEKIKNIGGNRGKFENHIPQNIHNPDKIRKVSFEEWFPKLRKIIDISKSINPDTNFYYTKEELLKVGQCIYRKMITYDQTPLQKRENGNKQNFDRSGCLSEPIWRTRFFYFKDSDSYLSYNQEFGWGDEGLFDMFMGHIKKMSRVIALLETMGSNPDAIYRTIKMQMESLPRKEKCLLIDPLNSWTGEYRILTELDTEEVRHMQKGFQENNLSMYDRIEIQDDDETQKLARAIINAIKTYRDSGRKNNHVFYLGHDSEKNQILVDFDENSDFSLFRFSTDADSDTNTDVVNHIYNLTQKGKEQIAKYATFVIHWCESSINISN